MSIHGGSALRDASALVGVEPFVQVEDAWGLLSVPKTSSTSCDQAVFVDQTTDASLSCYAVLLKVDRFG